MASKESDEPRFQIHQIVLLVAAVTGGVWLYQGPLKSSRPIQDTDNKSVMARGEERVQARLWQDPFEAVEMHLKSEESDNSKQSASGKNTHSHSLTLVATEVATSTPTPLDIQILAILTDGSPYADNRESRLRQRFAVLAGLTRAGYTPIDGEHIRFFYWDKIETCHSTSAEHQRTFTTWAQWPRIAEETGGQEVPIKNDHCQRTPTRYWDQAPVPVEWYQSVNGGNSHVLVFWIKDQDLGKQPLGSLQEIQRTVERSFLGLHPIVSLKVIGPRFSGTLQAMVTEAKGDTEVASQPSLTIYSPWSTTPEAFLIPHNHDNQSVAQHLKKMKATFVRTIPTDEQLIVALFDELERRGVTLKCENEKTCNHIAVISEWDTLYGRTLPRLVRKKITDVNNGKSIGFHQYSYLRGLDGELPRAKSNNNSEPSSGDTTASILSPKDRSQDIARMERPEGRSQLDYVRQLTELIREKEERIRTECDLWKKNCPGFKAIGVLGSDVYDKLLILQALKKSFPRVIFFTTDLDARLFHPSELAWTRNLVVASHFDLNLNNHLQGIIPPFRDTYQTATFFAVLRALDVLKESASQQERSPIDKKTILSFQPGGEKLASFESIPRIKIHEIGRNGPVDISVDIDLPDEAQEIFAINAPRLPPPNTAEARFTILILAVGLLIILVLLIPASVNIFRWLAVEQLRNPTVSTSLIIVLGILTVALYWFAPYLVSNEYEGEPFSLFDGVSVWPSQILRSAVIALSLIFWLKLYWGNNYACADLEQQFPELLKSAQDYSDTPSPRTASLSGPLLKIWHAICSVPTYVVSWHQRSIGGWALGKEVEEPYAAWKKYREYMDPVRIIVTVGFWSAVFYVIGMILMAINGMPSIPFRGHVAKQVNFWVLQFAVLCMIATIFLVLDITRLTSIFIEKLIPKEVGIRTIQQSLARLQLIARLTQHIDKFIYYPTSLLALMLAARSDYIDNWDFSIGLIIVISLSAFYVVVSAFQLRRASECARRRVLHDLSRRKLTDHSPDPIKQAIEEVEGLSEGAFMPITELPVFRAVTLPTGAYAILALVETFIKN